MLLIELLITFGLVILIWIIQLLHYPSFRFIEAARFSTFAQFHSQRISIIVMPLMLLELGIGLYLRDPISLSITGLIWLSTFTLQVPCHNKLQAGIDHKAIEKLITSNWIRTILWSAKFVYLYLKFD